MHGLELRPATHEDQDFCFFVLKATMRAYVEQIWGWDDEWQRTYFASRYDPALNQVILLDGVDVGVFSVEERADELFVSRLYILPAYQRRGIGTCLLQSVLDKGKTLGRPVRLQVLVNNPARRLYERLGFRPTGETATHLVMEHVSDGAPSHSAP
jgi:GNAT superfamily N-acetyltransferase